MTDPRDTAPQQPPERKPKRARDIYAEIHNHDGNGGGCVPGKCACPCGCEVQLGCTAYGVRCSQCQLDQSREGECRNITAKREQAEAEYKQAQIDRIAALEAQLAEAQERLAMVVEAASKIHHWHCWGSQEEGMVVSSKSVHGLWDALSATAASVAQHTAEVERRGAKAALEAFAERDDWTLDVPRSLVDRIRRLLTEAARAAELEGLDSDKT